MRRGSQRLELRAVNARIGGKIQPPLRCTFVAYRLQLRGETSGLQCGLPALGGLAAAVAAQGDAVGLFAAGDDQQILEPGCANALCQRLRGCAIR